LFHKFYIPVEKIAEKYRVENINIRNWIEEGIVTATNKPTVDYDFIIEDIKKDNLLFNIKELAYDKWQSNELINKLDDLFPNIILIQYDQSLKQMGCPSKEYESLIMNDRIIDANPCQKWMISNAVIKPDVNNNYKPLKENKSSTKRIDGVITSIMAIDRLNVNKNVTPDNKDFNSILSLF